MLCSYKADLLSDSQGPKLSHRQVDINCNLKKKTKLSLDQIILEETKSSLYKRFVIQIYS